MYQNSRLYLVDERAMPEVYLKVLEARRGLEAGTDATVTDAVGRVGISRSVFYKYRGLIRSMTEIEEGGLTTFYALLEDKAGALSALLRLFYERGSNILTINQNIPVNGSASVTLSARGGDIDAILRDADRYGEILQFEVIGRQ